MKNKKFYIVKTKRYYDGTKCGPTKVLGYYETEKEANFVANGFNETHSKEKYEALYQSWVEDKEQAWATPEWFERIKQRQSPFYETYEVKAR